MKTELELKKELFQVSYEAALLNRFPKDVENETKRALITNKKKEIKKQLADIKITALKGESKNDKHKK